MRLHRNTCFSGYIIALLAVIFCGLSVTSCSINDAASRPIVSVGDKVLDYSDLLSTLPPTDNADDSALYANNFIRNWIHKQLILQTAEKNLLDDDESVDHLVDEFRTSLLVERYQQKLIEQKFTPKVSENDLSGYYAQHKTDFVLRESIVKGVYAVIPEQSPDIKGFVKILTNLDNSSSLNVEQYLFKYSTSYKVFVDEWLSLSSVSRFFPSGTLPDDAKALKSRNIFEFHYEGNVYLLKVIEISLANSTAPYEFVRSDIYNILVGKQKADFIASVYKNIYDQAISDNTIKYYDKSEYKVSR